MIYSPDHNFLLIKNMKVGSTSLEVELSKVLPENAIVTIINPANTDHKPRNFGNFKSHESFSEAASKINMNGVRSYTVVRNPYECVLSAFFSIPTIRKISKEWDSIKKNERIDIVEKYFSNKISDGCFLSSTKNLYTDGKNILVSDLLRYENGLENEINRVLPSHGIPKITINTFEKSRRPKHISYNDVFTKSQIEKIQEEWSWEFDNLGYNR